MKAEDEWLASVKSDNSPIISDVSKYGTCCGEKP
jgi:hypothetical protein